MVFSASVLCKALLCDMTDKRFLIILSFCEFADKHIAAAETEIMNLIAELSALKQTLLQLDGA